MKNSELGFKAKSLSEKVKDLNEKYPKNKQRE